MTSIARTEGRRPVAARTRTSWVVPAIIAIPDRALVWSLCAVLATSITVQLNVFHPYTVFPLMLVLIAATWRLTPPPFVGAGVQWRRPRPEQTRPATTDPASETPEPAPARTDPASETVGTGPGAARIAWISVVVMVVLLLAWMAVQQHYFSELLSVRRDPSIYTLRGIWLMDHPSPDVTFPQSLVDVARAVGGVGLDFGSETYKTTRYFQSTTVVPGLIAVAGWIGGIPLLLKADVFIGGMALLSVYAVARRMAGPILGLLPTCALALSMPMVAFTRTAYTEPLSIIAVMACLLGLWQAGLTQRRSMWILAGIGTGCVPICRIDGWVVVLGAYVGIGIWGLFATSPATRRAVGVGWGWFSLAALPVAALGYTDLRFHSPDYLHALTSSYRPLVIVSLVVAVVALLVIVIPGIPGLAGWLRRRSVLVSRVIVGAIGVLIVLVMLRPLYYVAHHLVGDKATQVQVGTRQLREKLPVDPTESYDQESVTWIAWYLGWPAVIMASAAGLWAIRVAVRRLRPELVLVVSVVAINAALYLNVISITPDQIWAMRRFLPVILPGGLLIMAWGLQQLYDHRSVVLGRFTPHWQPVRRARVATAVIAVLGVLALVFPAASWNVSLFRSKEGAGQYNFVQQLCTEVEGQRVLLVGSIPTMGYYQPTLRNICHSTVITVPSSTVAIAQQRIAQVLQNWGPGPVKVVVFNITGIPWSTPPSNPTFSVAYSMWESVLSHRPMNIVNETTKAWLGTAQADGTVVPG